MQKYKFSLEKLLDFKQQMLKKEKNTLFDLNQLKQNITDNIVTVTEKRTNIYYELEERKNSIIKPELIRTYKNYIICLDAEIEKLKKSLEIVEKQVEEQLKVVVDISKEINTLEKLEEKQRDEYNKLEVKEQEAFIEEFVSHSQLQSTCV